MVFLSEPQIHSCNLEQAMKHFRGSYSASLNSADKYDPELPLLQSRAHGGTLVMWKCQYDPHITLHPVQSTAFLPVLFHPPGSALSVHIAVYLPTLGQENEFLDELTKLSIVIDEIQDANPAATFYLRGDFNVSQTNTKRTLLLDHFSTRHSLTQVIIPKPTYHHFVGNGKSDSYLDKILFTSTALKAETLQTIECGQTNPLVDSHHDLLVSCFEIPDEARDDSTDGKVTAPVIENKRVKVIWSDAGIQEYQSLVLPHLSRLQELWLSSPTRTSTSLLLQSTYNVLNDCAALTNKTIPLDQNSAPRPVKTPKAVIKSQKSLLKQNRELRRDIENGRVNIAERKASYNASRILHRKLERSFKARDSIVRDRNLCSSDLSPIFASVRRSKRTKAGRINKLYVGGKSYVGESVKDGFYDSISTLKTKDNETLAMNPYFRDFSSDYQNILEICKHGAAIPPVDESYSFDLLQRMKPEVNDFFGITANHYNYAGPAGWLHFHLLLNCLLNDVNNTSISEINVVYACILFKGHGKEKTSDRSYRTISTCPMVAKALDLYIRDLNICSWNKDQASTQFQGEGSSHELAAVLLTETIQHSLYTLNEPIFILLLDAQSAFDVVLSELLVKNLFHCSTDGQALIYLNNRFQNRQTCIDWNGQMMGPIHDERGVEQGGVNSSDFYKIFGKEQLSTAQESKLGVPLGRNLTISAIGLADDTGLLSNSIHNLQYLLRLSQTFCKKYGVSICSEKTKLLVFTTKNTEEKAQYYIKTNPISIDDEKVVFVNSAEHVGIVRSTAGNLPAIMARFIAHKKALGAVLHAGLARGHRGNPAASLRVVQTYGVPVLLSGLATLVLSKSEEKLIEQHHKEIIANVQRLLPCTPRSVTFFLAGSLPGTALLHLRQLSIFGMICRLPENILHTHAVNIFSSSTHSSSSWFHRIREICLQYRLPHPLVLLKSPLQKDTFKRLVKKHVVDYWEQFLRAEAAVLDSLVFFKPAFYSLQTPHPLWSTAGSSPIKISMATIQAQMVSGRFRTEELCSNWSKNKKGVCLLSPSCSLCPEDLTHILSRCPALQPTRDRMMKYTNEYSRKNPIIKPLLLRLCVQSSPTFCQFLLDCSPLPEVISAVHLHGSQIHDHLFQVTRTWIYTLHKVRMKLLGRWRNFK